MSSKSLALLLGMAFCALPLAHADTTYNTLPLWNGSNYVYSFGAPNTATYGQVFQAPTDNVLTDFTFYIQGSAGTQVTFNPEVYAWNGSMATGTALYSGAPVTLSANGSFIPVTIDTGDVDLTTGSQYVAFLTVTSADQASSTGLTDWGLSSGTSAGSTEFVYLNNGGDSSQLTTATWGSFAANENLAYTADFTSAVAPTPEPGSLALLGTGVLALAGVARRRLRV